jgi:hypothetical protein
MPTSGAASERAGCDSGDSLWARWAVYEMKMKSAAGAGACRQ